MSSAICLFCKRIISEHSSAQAIACAIKICKMEVGS